MIVQPADIKSAIDTLDGVLDSQNITDSEYRALQNVNSMLLLLEEQLSAHLETHAILDVMAQVLGRSSNIMESIGGEIQTDGS